MADDCGVVDIGCKVETAISDAITDLANKIITAAGDAIGSLATFWIDVDAPSVGTSSGAPRPAVAFLQNSLSWYTAAAAVIAVLIGGARMAWERRAQPGTDLLKALLTLTLVAGASLAFISIAVTAADGATAAFAPRFVVLRSETDPKLQIRGGSPGGVNYNLTTWGKDDRPSADPDLHVPDGSDPGLDHAFGSDRTADLFRACPTARIEAESASGSGDGIDGVRWHFKPTASFSLTA